MEERNIIVSNGILKAFGQEVDLTKGGEGSRGGKVIGHTSSGKPIYDHFEHPSHKNFDKDDHKDAKDLHDMNSRSAWDNAEESDLAGNTKEGDKHQETAMHHDKQSLLHGWLGGDKERADLRRKNLEKQLNKPKESEHLPHKEAIKHPKGGSQNMTDDHFQAQAADIIGRNHGLRSESVYNWGNKHGVNLSSIGHHLSNPKNRDSVLHDVMNDKHEKTKDFK